MAATGIPSASIKASAGPGLALSRIAIRIVVAIGVLIMVVPLLMTAYMSLFADGVVVFPPSGYTLSWYGRLNEFPKFTQGLSTSLRVAGMATLCSLIIGVPASIALVRYSFPGRSLLNVLLCHFPFKSRNRSSAFSTCYAGR